MRIKKFYYVRAETAVGSVRHLQHGHLEYWKPALCGAVCASGWLYAPSFMSKAEDFKLCPACVDADAQGLGLHAAHAERERRFA